MKIRTYTFNGKEYPITGNRHGGPWDRGSADSYYMRGSAPHYFVGKTYMSDIVEEADMTEDEIQQYLAGYSYNENVIREFKM